MAFLSCHTFMSSSGPIYDVAAVERFVHQFLHPLPNHVFLLQTIERKKYGAEHNRIPPFVFLNGPDEVVPTLTQFTPYTDAQVCFVYLNPRNVPEAFRAFTDQTLRDLASQRPLDATLPDRLQQCLQRAPRVDRFFEVDVDTKDPEVLAEVRRDPSGIVATLETRGGYHVILDRPSNDQKRRLHMLEQEYPERVSLRRDASPPVPGTLQGGFRVRVL